MHIVLGDYYDTLVRKQVESGCFADASDVVREALRLLEAQQRHQVLLDAINEAEAQVARGETVPLTPKLMERLSREAAENARMGKPITNVLVTPG